MDPSNRNPVIVPQKEDRRVRCPSCKDPGNWTARNVQGTYLFTCKCGHKWQGGVGQLPQDPNVPLPPMDPRDRPVVEHVGVRDEKGNIVRVEEITRRPDLAQSFRKGHFSDDEEY